MNKTKFWAQLNILFALFIIIWGAWVRLSGSGAGCGDHWPLCNGEVVPLDQGIKTLIEYTHRVTSGIFGFTILAMVIISLKEFPKRHLARRATILALVLTIIEALIGAVLVKRGLVVDNASLERAFVIGIHLINTFFLLGSLVMCVYFSKAKDFVKQSLKSKEKIWRVSVVVLFLLVGASGAITALGNTLFPEPSLVAGIQNDFSSDAPFLIRLRIYHPLLATTLVLILTQWSLQMKSGKDSFHYLLILSLGSLAFGVVNWLLMAPIWGALIHLLLADLLWMKFSYCLLKTRYHPTI